MPIFADLHALARYMLSLPVTFRLQARHNNSLIRLPEAALALEAIGTGHRSDCGRNLTCIPSLPIHT
jgi:hypothetical protein